MKKYPLQGRVIVITGSTGGLGQLLARALKNRGARLALLDMNAEKVAQQAQALGDAEVARGWQADVRDYAALERVMHEVAEHFGGIDVVVAGAGIGSMAPMSTLEPHAFEQVIDINLTGVWRTFRAALPYVKARRGYLLAVSSMAAFIHSPMQAPYTASKAALWAMTDSLRLELRGDGVGVGSLHPTFFRTPMMDDVVEDPAGRLLWGGNAGGVWKMIPIEEVVVAAVEAIEGRMDIMVAPRTWGAFPAALTFVRRVVERLGFDDRKVRQAMQLASPTGWNNPNAAARTTEQ